MNMKLVTGLFRGTLLALFLVTAAVVWAQESPDTGKVATEEAIEEVTEKPVEGEQAEEKLPQVSIAVSVESVEGRETALGTIVIDLYPDQAPLHVENFLKLVDDGFYVGTTFHRIVPAFIVQGGDLISKRNWTSSKLGTGADGPDYTIPAEIGAKHVRGAVAAARTPDAVNPNRESSPSQFYISLADLPALDSGGYTVFGQVVKGMDVVDKIARVKNSGTPRNQALQRVKMIQVKRVP